MIHFPISGLDTYWWLPIAVAFVISSITSTAGITGAFLLLPFQISILGYAGPGASSTNLLFNIIAAPAGVYKYIRDQRIVWQITIATIVFILPGFIVGALIRIHYLPEARPFKLFVAIVLLYVVGQMLINELQTARRSGHGPKVQSSNRFVVSHYARTGLTLCYQLDGQAYSLSLPKLLPLCLVVGVISGIYGIGGGAFLAPILVALYRQPIHAVSGIALLSTFAISIMGVLVYLALEVISPGSGTRAGPDYWLGFLFGIGGLAGIYTGVSLQKYLPVRLVKMILAGCMLIIIGRYLLEYFRI